jgi:cytochrome c oxidase cbb3-type subunit 3
MKKIAPLLLFLLAPIMMFGQEVESKTFWDDPVNHPMTPVYALFLLMAIVVVLIILVAIAMFKVINTLVENVEKEKAASLGLAYKPRVSMLTKMVQSLNASVPLEDESKIELEHNYDGIKELDNHLPPWWKWLFYGTIGWAGVYIVVYHMSSTLPLQDDEYRNEIAAAEETAKKLQSSKPKVDIDENALTFTQDAAIITKGKEIYSINCSPCHKQDGGGGIGPNLTDEYWLHGGHVKNIYATIKNGVPEKGMISWANTLSPEQLRDVSFFVMSLQGSNPAGAKAPQGDIFKTGATEGVKADTVKAQASL